MFRKPLLPAVVTNGQLCRCHKSQQVLLFNCFHYNINVHLYFLFTGCFVDEGDFFHLQSGQFSEDMIPTVGFNMRKVTKGNVTIKVSLKAFIKVL